MTTDEEIIRAVEQACDEVDPETGALFDFYARLLRRLAARRATLDRDPATLFDAAQAAARLRAGEPQLTFDRLGLQAATFGPWAREVRDLLAERDPGLAFEAEALDDETALTLARASFEQGTTGDGPALDAIIANALAPWLEQAAALILPRLPLALWRQAYCPICSGAPDFAAIEPDGKHRTLLCERCRAEWPVPVGFCVFCGEDDPTLLGYYSSPDETYRLDVCDRCGHYLKVILRRAAPAALLPAERLLTPGLDLLAAEEGYTRPAGWENEL
ncbi:MAG: formate dehydrogenase accessory protein FdhE [Ardenticatenaceae bacterium]|nr:formate dehydrogenase accessory protein FdhE [Ardenticatenaceae bacterium]